MLAPWAGDKSALRKPLAEKFKPGIKSHLYDSLLYAAEELLPKVSGPRTVVLLSDGYDSYTKNTLDRAREALDRARATVYVIAQNSMILKNLKPVAFNHCPVNGINFTDPRYRDLIVNMRRYASILESEVATLKHLAEDSGGAFWGPATVDEFKEAGRLVTSEIGSEYVIAYSSERSPGDQGFHPLKVYPARPGLKVRARRGVYSALPPAAESHNHPGVPSSAGLEHLKSSH